MSVRWRLHFEFTTSLKPDKGDKTLDYETSEQLNQHKNSDALIKQLEIESMMWDLPVRILPTNPIQTSLMMQTLFADTVVL